MEAAFKVGDRIAVRDGVEDPDFPGIALSGWTGAVVSVEEQRYEVLFDFEYRRTVQNFCDEDDLESEVFLDQSDLLLCPEKEYVLYSAERQVQLETEVMSPLWQELRTIFGSNTEADIVCDNILVTKDSWTVFLLYDPTADTFSSAIWNEGTEANLKGWSSRDELICGFYKWLCDNGFDPQFE